MQRTDTTPTLNAIDRAKLASILGLLDSDKAGEVAAAAYAAVRFIKTRDLRWADVLDAPISTTPLGTWKDVAQYCVRYGRGTLSSGIGLLPLAAALPEAQSQAAADPASRVREDGRAGMSEDIRPHGANGKHPPNLPPLTDPGAASLHGNLPKAVQRKFNALPPEVRAMFTTHTDASPMRWRTARNGCSICG